MSTNKYLKSCVIFLAVIVLLLAAVVAWYYRWKDDNQKRAKADQVKFAKSCDTITLITEKPSVTLHHFDKKEIDRLKYYLVRNKKIIMDTMVNYQINPTDEYLYAEIPFDRFLKTDTIIVETYGKGKKYYQISGFHHYAYLHYGMMGYLGSYDCRLDDENFLINGKSRTNQLLKTDGLNKLVIPE